MIGRSFAVLWATFLAALVAFTWAGYARAEYAVQGYNAGSGLKTWTVIVDRPSCLSVLAAYDTLTALTSGTDKIRGQSCSTDPVGVGTQITVYNLTTSAYSYPVVGFVTNMKEGVDQYPLQEMIFALSVGFAGLVGVAVGVKLV